MNSLRAVLFVFALSWMLISCKSGYESITLQQNDIQPILESDSPALKFHATIDLFRNHFSGILVAKQTDSLTAHLIFVSEIGMKIFDLELGKDSIHIAYAFPGLESRPKAMELLKADLGAIFLYGIYNRPAYIRVNLLQGYSQYWERRGRHIAVFKEEGWKGKELVKVKEGGRWRKATRIHYYYEDRKLHAISFIHKGLVRLTIQLNALEKS